MIVSQNGSLVSTPTTRPAAFTLNLTASSTPVVVQHPLAALPSAVSFVDTAGVPHEVDWTAEPTFPYAVHLPTVRQAGTLTIR